MAVVPRCANLGRAAPILSAPPPNPSNVSTTYPGLQRLPAYLPRYLAFRPQPALRLFLRESDSPTHLRVHVIPYYPTTPHPDGLHAPPPIPLRPHRLHHTLRDYQLLTSLQNVQLPSHLARGAIHFPLTRTLWPAPLHSNIHQAPPLRPTLHT